jgi:hypothetical protein
MSVDPWGRTLIAERAMVRAKALTIACRFCGAIEGEWCFNKTTGEQLEYIPAHLYRLQDTGAV